MKRSARGCDGINSGGRPWASGARGQGMGECALIRRRDDARDEDAKARKDRERSARGPVVLRARQARTLVPRALPRGTVLPRGSFGQRSPDQRFALARNTVTCRLDSPARRKRKWEERRGSAHVYGCISLLECRTSFYYAAGRSMPGGCSERSRF
jgi:hypothetical protein